jgi:transcriptional regulator NrdR family protein
MVEIKELAEKVLEFLHEEDASRGRLEVHMAALYKKFEKQASYEVVLQAIEFLVDRDLIAPASYTLTAKGRREHNLKRTN